MSLIVATATSPEPGQPGQPGKDGVQVVRVADITRTANQVAVLLNLAGSLIPYLRSDVDPGAHCEIDEVAKAEARKTFELAHIRLRGIVDEEARWGLHDDMSEPFRVLREGQERAAAAEIALVEKRTEMLQDLRRPCRLFAAQVAQFPTPEGARWVAFIGQAPQENGLLGVGSSPEEAFDAFDRAYFQRADNPPPAADDAPVKPEPQSPKPRRRKRKAS